MVREKQRQSLHRMIIVGGGAGGLELATRLGDRLGARRKHPTAHIMLVDRSPIHVWKPLLHEVAAGSMDAAAHRLEYAAQARWHGFTFQLGELTTLDRTAKKITLSPVLDKEGTELLPMRTLYYDTLVIAIGSTTHFFGVSGAEEYAIALDTVAQAERFRHRLLATCMRAGRHSTFSMPSAAQVSPTEAPSNRTELNPPNPTQRAEGKAQLPIQIAIVGGGATGIELSAELRNTAQVFAAYGLYLDSQRDIDIVVIEAGPRILSALPERLSTTTARLLKRLGIQLMVGERVAKVSDTQLFTVSGKTLRADLTVWAAGIKAPTVLSQLDGLTTNRLGQLNVRTTLQTENDDDIFALGDCASCPWLEQQTMVPPRAQAAHQQASFLVHAFQCRLSNRPLPLFHYHDFGSLVSLGRFGAVGNLMGGHWQVEGLLARFAYTWLYRLHIAALHGFPRMILDTLAHWLRRSTLPRVKLH